MPRPKGRNTFPKPLRMRALRRDAKVVVSKWFANTEMPVVTSDARRENG